MKLEATPSDLSLPEAPLGIVPSVKMNPEEAPERLGLNVTINGREYSFQNLPANMLLIDLLHEQEELRLTGTKFNCGIGSCGTCKVAVQETANGPYMGVLACFARVNSLEGMHVTTVEHLAGADKKLHPLQQAFVENFAFQCGFCTPGFLMAGIVLIDSLTRQPVRKSDLEDRIYRELSGHLCRCTGYARYLESIRDVILADGRLVVEDDEVSERPTPSMICFKIRKLSGNDLEEKVLLGYLDEPEGRVEFREDLAFESCRARLRIPLGSIRTGERIRDLNLRTIFFGREPEMRFKMDTLRVSDERYFTVGMVPRFIPLPAEIGGELRFRDVDLRVTASVLVRVLSDNELEVITTNPIMIDLRELKLPVAAFALEFGLKLSSVVEVTLNLRMPYGKPSQLTDSLT